MVIHNSNGEISYLIHTGSINMNDGQDAIMVDSWMEDSIYMSECGDTASIKVNDGPDVIMVESWMEDSI